MELLKLKKRRGAQKSAIARQITKLGETEDMDHFQTIMKSLQTKYAALVDLNENILALTDEDDYETEMVDTEDFMLDLKLKLQDFQKKMSADGDIPPPLLNPEEPPLGQQPSRDHSHSASDDSSATSRDRTYVSNSSVNSSQSSQFHKLPKFSRPIFTGNILEWQTFWDSFKSSVHHNDSLSDIQRFSYLRSLLQGGAARVIEGFPLTQLQALKKEIDILESGLPTLTSEIYPATASFFTSTGAIRRGNAYVTNRKLCQHRVPAWNQKLRILYQLLRLEDPNPVPEMPHFRFFIL